jgi:hypothetical protein
MFRESLRMCEIKVSHDLSSRFTSWKHEKISRIENEYFTDSKIEMKNAG